MPESGKDWVKKFPTSTSVDDLEPGFRDNVKAFIKALKDAGATTTISATVRPPQRAYLMNGCWRIDKAGVAPGKIASFKPKDGQDGVDIQWVHKKADGSSDIPASLAAAKEMVAAYGMTKLKVAPALQSNHIVGRALDMSVSWKGTLSIKDSKGNAVAIKSAPRDSTNADLIKVAKTYGVVHLIDVMKDPPHWSTNGR